MTVFKCDRCGSIYENSTTARTPKYTVQKHSFPTTDIEIDLCPKCLALLENFMEKKASKGE